MRSRSSMHMVCSLNLEPAYMPCLTQVLSVRCPGCSLVIPSSCSIMPILEVLATGTHQQLNRPCVDCGLFTGRFCDHCYAADRIPDEDWAPGQLTPLCSKCDNRHHACHFCCGEVCCMPEPHARSCGHGLIEANSSLSGIA